MKYLLLIAICLVSAFAASFIQLDATRKHLSVEDEYAQNAQQQAAHKLGARLVATLVEGRDTPSRLPPGFIGGLHGDTHECNPALNAIYRIKDSQDIFFAYGCLARILLERAPSSAQHQQAI